MKMRNGPWVNKELIERGHLRCRPKLSLEAMVRYLEQVINGIRTEST